MKSVISGDIIAYTSLTDKGRTFLEESIHNLFSELNYKFDVFSRMIKGDYIECVIPNPENGLKIALIIKTFLKSLSSNETFNDNKDSRFKYFKTHAVRIAVGYGELTRYDPEKGIIDGEAIYLSGRKISEESSYKKKRIIIKNTLFFVSNIEKLNKEIEPLFALIDVILTKATAKQCEVIFWKLMDLNEEAIASKIKIAQPVVNQHSTSAGWNGIEKAVNRFNEIIKTT